MWIYLDIEVVLCIRNACEDRGGDNAVDKAAGYGSVGEAGGEHRAVGFVVGDRDCIIESFLTTRIERVGFADGICGKRRVLMLFLLTAFSSL